MRSIWFLILLGSLITYHCLTTVAGEEAQPSTDASQAQPTLEQCKGYVDAALKTSSPEGETEEDAASTEDSGEPPDGDGAASTEDGDSEEAGDDSKAEGEEGADDGDSQEVEEGESEGATAEDDDQSTEAAADDDASQEGEGTAEEQSEEDDGESKEESEAEEGQTAEEEGESSENGDGASEENAADAADTQEDGESEEATAEDNATAESEDATAEENAAAESEEATAEDGGDASPEGDSGEATAEDDGQTAEDTDAPAAASEEGDSAEDGNSAEKDGGEQESAEEGDGDGTATAEDSGEDAGAKSDEDDKSVDGDTQEDTAEEKEPDSAVSGDVAEQADQPDESGESQEDQATQEDQASAEDADSPEAEAGVSEEGDAAAAASEEGDSGEAAQASAEDQNEDATAGSEEEASSEEEEEQEYVEPYEPRSRDHITKILGLDDSEETKTTFTLLDKVTTTTLKELKSTYENAIKPLEQMYKYRDLSNRHFGDPEIFSKPLIVFMGPWSGGKSTIINWLLGIQHEDNALRTGADPSPAQFNIMMYGKEPEKLDGTQLAADWTFSGLQKFGQSFLDRLRGQKLPNRLLEKVNIVEIPGILEVRKQVERSFPFNDACQWFIDRADTLFLIYDPAKLDIGPETEAILDQLKGRENQVRIVLNKADTVKPDELMRVQAMLVWNISPLMSSAEPPIMYAASLWDHPLQPESPKSLLVAHENNFLKDIRDGVERRVETRIAAARRFAVRVRNHAKMVDCYLNTFNNHRSFFGDRKKITTDIIDHPQNYHIYEGLSTLNNISRYDLPDPDTYRDFFRINPLWDFPTLQSTCSFWRGCPLHKLDIAIAYDLPEILGKFRRQRESIRSAQKQGSSKN